MKCLKMPKGKPEAVSRRRTNNTMVWFNFGFGVMLFNDTFNNIAVISWRSVPKEKDKNWSIKHHTETNDW